MTTYYFTFMQKQLFKDFYVRIDAPNFEDARYAMLDQFFDKWSMQYTEDTFEPQYCPRGCLAHIVVTEEGCAIHKGDSHAG